MEIRGQNEMGSAQTFWKLTAQDEHSIPAGRWMRGQVEVRAMDEDNYWVICNFVIYHTRAMKLKNHLGNPLCLRYNLIAQLPFQLEIAAIRNTNNNSYASLDNFEYHVTDDCMLEPPAADPDSCGEDEFLCRKDDKV